MLGSRTRKSVEPIAGDVHYTPVWVVQRILANFMPDGRILDPCAGGGAFSQRIPGCKALEIACGQDFFAWTEPVDWIIGNPPYSVFAAWMRHSMRVAENIVYLLPLNKPFLSQSLVRDIFAWGGISEIQLLGGGSAMGFPLGFAMGAFHFRRGHKGLTRWTPDFAPPPPGSTRRVRTDAAPSSSQHSTTPPLHSSRPPQPPCNPLSDPGKP